MRVLVVDSGTGNLRSVRRALERAGATVVSSADPEAIRAADRVVVPGQGSFGAFARALGGGLGEAIREHIARDRPYLGICLGLQALFDGSDEAPGAPGLGVLAGHVRRLSSGRVDSQGRRFKVPHMGWNDVRGAHPLLPDRGWFYFVHSFVADPGDPSVTVGVADYGEPLCAAVARSSLFACQFHPEKSQREGARLLARFLEGGWS